VARRAVGPGATQAGRYRLNVPPWPAAPASSVILQARAASSSGRAGDF
jgi:hypothetical protein